MKDSDVKHLCFVSSPAEAEDIEGEINLHHFFGNQSWAWVLAVDSIIALGIEI
jgi:hypothetical protein